MSEHWYVKSGKSIQGPYSEQRLRRYEAQGRLRPRMRLSADRETWVTPESQGFRTRSASGLQMPQASAEARDRVRALIEQHRATLVAEPTWSVAPELPAERLEGALGFALLVDGEELLAIDDMTLRGSGKLGCVFTDRGLHFLTHGEIPLFIPYPEVAGARLEVGPMTIGLRLSAQETLDFPASPATRALLEGLIEAVR